MCFKVAINEKKNTITIGLSFFFLFLVLEAFKKIQNLKQGSHKDKTIPAVL